MVRMIDVRAGKKGGWGVEREGTLCLQLEENLAARALCASEVSLKRAVACVGVWCGWVVWVGVVDGWCGRVCSES